MTKDTRCSTGQHAYWCWVDHQAHFTVMTLALFILGLIIGGGISGSLFFGLLCGGLGIGAGILLADILVNGWGIKDQMRGLKDSDRRWRGQD